MSWHQTIIVGNLGQDPELRDLDSGAVVCNFSVAVSERWRDRQTDEPRERTTWYRVAVWGTQGENCNTYLAKGDQVMVIGNVSPNAYINQDGDAIGTLNLNAQSVRFLRNQRDDDGGGQSQNGGRQRNQGGGQRDSSQSRRRQQRANRPVTNPDIDDIPF